MGHPVAIAGFVFCWLALGSSSAHFWLDSGEIAAAGASLGVMHPPGVAGYVPLLHLATLIPLGSLGFRMALVSSFFAGWALGTLASILERRDTPASVVWVVTLWIAVGLTFARNGRVVEIYAFGGFLMMATLWGFDPLAPRPKGPLLGTIAAVVGALGFGDLRLAFVVPVAVAWAIAWRRGEGWTRWAPLFVAGSAACVLTLVVSAGRAPMMDWGDPDGAGRLIDHIQARSIQLSFADQWFPSNARAWVDNFGRGAARLAEDLGPLGPAATLVAGFAWFRRRADRSLWWMALGLFAVETFYVVAVNPMGGADRQTGVPLALLCGLAVGVGLRDAARRAGRYAWAVLPLGFSILVAPPLTSGLGDLGVTRSWGPHAWTAGALEASPDGGLLITTSDDLAAGTIAARTLEGARPDLASVPAQHLYRPAPAAEPAAVREAWEAARLACSESARVQSLVATWRGPTLLERPADYGVDWRPAPRGLSIAAVGSPRPRLDLAAEARSLSDRWIAELPSPLDRRRLVQAIGGRVNAMGGRNDLAVHRSAIKALEIALAIDPDDAATRVTVAALLAGQGDDAVAVEHLQRALAVDPDRPKALTNLALLRARAGERGPALELSMRAIERHPSDTAVWRARERVCEMTSDDTCAQTARQRLDVLAARRAARLPPHCREPRSALGVSSESGRDR